MVFMKGQSAIEFLSTYAFLFIILGIVISILFYFATVPKATLPMQCSSFGGPNCNYIQYYTNTTAGYGYVLMSITNSQSAPINITNVTVEISNSKGVGVCNPSFLYPGQESTCLIPFSHPYAPQLTVRGFYSINAKYCNNGLNNIGENANCTEPASYGGSFATTATTSKMYIFSVVAMQSPPIQQLSPYSSVPTMPAGWTIEQNGDWIANSSFSYSYGTASYLGSTYLGIKTKPFPISVSTLGNNNVHCSLPYNSTLSLASTLFYLPAPASITFNIETDDAMAVYYKGPNVPQWTSAPGIGSSAWHGQGATKYTSNTISLTASGIYYVDIMWSNICTPGVQALNASI